MAVKSIFLTVVILAYVHQHAWATLDADCTDETSACDTATEICLEDTTNPGEKKCFSNDPTAETCTPECTGTETCDTSVSPPACKDASAETCTPECTGTETCDTSVSPPACKEASAETCTPECTGTETCDTSVSPPACKDPTAETCTPECTGTETCDTSVSPPACKENGGNIVAAAPGILLAVLLAAIVL